MAEFYGNSVRKALKISLGAMAGLALTCAVALTQQAAADTLTGPTFDKWTGFNNNQNWKVGLEFQALTTTYISGFTGMAIYNISDTNYYLYSSTGVLLNEITETPAAYTRYGTSQTYFGNIVGLQWDITQGQSYFLVGNATISSGEQPEYALYAGSPVGAADADILITGSGYNFNPATANLQPYPYWFAFQSITTGPVDVPEPASLALLGAGVAALGAVRRRLRR